MSTVVDDFSPMYVGDLLMPFTPQFVRKDGTPVNLTGATFSLKMQSEAGVIKTCTGPWTIDDPLLGKAHYQWQATDVDTAGVWQLFVTITISSLPVHADTKT